MKRYKLGQSGACGGLNAGTWPLRGPGFPSGRQGLALTDHQTQLPNIPGQRSHSEKATLNRCTVRYGTVAGLVYEV